jgi:hypothetical protein
MNWSVIVACDYAQRPKRKKCKKKEKSEKKNERTTPVEVPAIFIERVLGSSTPKSYHGPQCRRVFFGLVLNLLKE